MAAFWRRSGAASRTRWRDLGAAPAQDGWHAHADGIWLIREGSRVAVLERRCPHQGCLVHERGDDLWCPCHGSVFRRDGARTVGPSPRDLAWFAVRRSGEGLEWSPDVVSPAAAWIEL